MSKPSQPSRLAATLIATALAMAACTMKKAEVDQESQVETSDDQAALPAVPDAAKGNRDEKKSEPVAYVPKSHRADATATPQKSKEERSLMDRLYPSATATSPSPAPAPVAGSTNGAVVRQEAEMLEMAEGAAGYAAQPQALSRVYPKDKAYGAPAAKAAVPAELAANLGKRDRRSGEKAYREEDVDGGCMRCYPQQDYEKPPQPNSEEYASVYENTFMDAHANPLSTFSIDVDGASYSNTRRFIQEGQLPPADAVRLEEFVNYFDYDYPQPTGSDPFSITTELAQTPWNPDTKLVHIGLQGRRMAAENLPPNNLVFLIDVSGSMESPEKLPLLKDGFHMLIDQLRPQDRISIVVYAGAAGMVLSPTSGSDKQSIREALERLQAGGSTAGGAGLMLAYQAAQQTFIKGGSNRVILATDGDFNVGISSDADLVNMIEEKRKSGVFLSVLGFGTGNYKDAKMEQLADKGNGNYFYIDNINEARKVLVEKMTGTLYAIAKDVKLQIEFNPAAVKSYRLVGYENRVLAAEDFNDDRKDAGELGAGTSVTALYEIVPAAPARPAVDPLKYQNNGGSRWHWNWGAPAKSEEMLTVKFRYKQPQGSTSKLLSRTLRNRDAAWQDASENFRFSAAAAGFGMLLRNSRYSGGLDFDKVASMARGARGRDVEGHRAEFVTLVQQARDLAGNRQVGYRQYRE